MSLDFNLIKDKEEVFSKNITHNLTEMAYESDLYACLWRPIENGHQRAKDIIPSLQIGLNMLIINPDKYEKYNARNGWGTYRDFVYFVILVLNACRKYPDSIIEVSI